MQYYAAPLEGITGYLWRGAHSRWFPGVDRYFMPFLSPTKDHKLTRRELRDLLPEHNVGVNAVPQLLTRSAEDFLWTARALKDMGYHQVNLNLGCPSGTVVAKGKGSGFLSNPEELDRFLDTVFSAAPLPISIKTRLGRSEPGEFGRLLEIYNRYPLAELIIHARVQKDFYRYPARREVFSAVFPLCRGPVCYNGDLYTPADAAGLAAAFPALAALMAGRGLVGDPALLSKMRGGPAATAETLRAFHDELYGGYCRAFGSQRNAMMRMKELWFYLICLFGDHGTYAKKLRKTDDPQVYEGLVAGIFRDLPLLEEIEPGW